MRILSNAFLEEIKKINKSINQEQLDNILKNEIVFNDYKELNKRIKLEINSSENIEESKKINQTTITSFYNETLQFINNTYNECTYENIQKIYPDIKKEEIDNIKKVIDNENKKLKTEQQEINQNFNKINDSKTVVTIDTENFLEKKQNFEQISSNRNWDESVFETKLTEESGELMKEWKDFLEKILEKPKDNFIINKNTVTNFEMIFRNPETGLTNKNQPEPIVHISYNSSRRTEPVFSIGSSSFSGKSFGPKLISGTLVVTAFRNVPLSSLHAISKSESYSVEDLPPLDLYIIPKEDIYDGRFETLIIKGITFMNTNQNNNASSTGIYNSFQFFAKNVEPVHFADVKTFFEQTKKI